MIVYFFFQAEDGIRDRNVTGVQTCALPIYDGERRRGARAVREHELRRFSALRGGRVPRVHDVPGRHRSEERRVGKECRSWWGPDEEKKKTEENKVRTVVGR